MSADESPRSNLVLYQDPDGRTRIQCRFEGETIWLTQALIAELFAVTVPTVNEHLKGIYEDAELPREATIRSFPIVRTEGERSVTREVEVYKASGKAKLHSYIISHRPHPGFGTDPYAIAVVKLEEGVQMMSNIVDCPQTPEALVLDMPLEVTFEVQEKDETIHIPLFKPAEG